MDTYVSFAVWTTVLYFLCLVGMIGHDLYKQGHKTVTKPGIQTLDVSDMVGNDQAKEVVEETKEQKELKEVMRNATCEDESGLRIFSPPQPSPTDTPVPPEQNEEKKKEKEEKLMAGQEEISPKYGFQSTPDEFYEYLSQKGSSQSRQIQKKNVIDRL